MPYSDQTVARGKASGSTTLSVPTASTPTSSTLMATRATPGERGAPGQRERGDDVDDPGDRDSTYASGASAYLVTSWTAARAVAASAKSP